MVRMSVIHLTVLHAPLLVFPHFDIMFNLLMNRFTATQHLVLKLIIFVMLKFWFSKAILIFRIISLTGNPFFFTCCVGGPGSAKGCIVNDLKAMFGFAFISAEDLILQKLPKRAAEDGKDPVSGTHGLAELLKDNPEYLTLDWVLEILLEEIEKFPNQPILVDLIPNLKFLMRVDNFIKKCDIEMKEFEQKVFYNLYLMTYLSLISGCFYG